MLVCSGAVGESGRLLDGWEFVKGEIGGPWEAWRTGRPAEFPVWQPVGMPHCFNAFDAVDPDINYYQGPGWYRIDLVDDNPFESGRTLLHFEGAGQKTDVYVFEDKVGSHVGGYDEFTVDITDAVAKWRNHPAYSDKVETMRPLAGRIPITIRCDNSRNLEMIPSDLSDFNVYGGMYRYVNLQYTPAISLERVHVKARGDGATVTARLHNPAALFDHVTLTVKIIDPAGYEVASHKAEVEPWPGEETVFIADIASPVLWSPDHPNLYRCTVSLESRHGKMQVEERFGVRSFEFMERGPFMLNGERLLLRGMHRHEDHAGLAAAMTEELLRKEMVMMKNIGVNFIRLGHYQQSRIVLDLCDELGILVWEEIPWCRGGLGGEEYRQQARDMLTSLIDQHHNHPAVIIWGLGNENDWPGDFEEFDEDKIHAFMSELNDLAHELDPERKTAIRRCKFCTDVVDVYSPSIWAGWYRGKYTDYKQVSFDEMQKVDRYLHVEWGASHHARRHSEDPDMGLASIAAGGGADERAGDYLMTGGEARVSRDGTWTETYACNLIDWHLKEQETMEWLTGTAYWPFKDFSTPIRPDNPVPYVNQKGIVERDLTPKESYYVFQSYWTETPMAYIYGHTWPVRWGAADEKRLVKVYSNCSSAELFLNGESQGKRSRDSQNFPAAGLRWAVQLKPGGNHVKVVAEKDGTIVTDELTWEYQTETWDKPARLTLKLIAQDNDIATVEVLALDEKGVPCLDAGDFIRFDLTGDGRLIDNLGTSTAARRVQLYTGRARISLNLNNGTSVVSAAAEGMETMFLTVK
jgi:beta-galactosidase